MQLKRIKPKLILGIMLLFVLSACSVFQKSNKDSGQSGNDATKNKKETNLESNTLLPVVSV